MNITNKLGLPDAIVRAVTNDPYSRGDADFSASDLVNPPQLVALKRAHESEISEDVSDRVWALFGQAAHVVLERAANGGHQELRLFAECVGKRISGQIDSMVDGTVTDYKTTSAWGAVLEGNGVKPEWEQQLNVYAWLARMNSHEVKALEVLAIYRDWSQSQAEKSKDYPKVPVALLPVKLWHPDDAAAFAVERVNELVEAMAGNPRPCTTAETWERWDNRAGMAKRPRCERYCAASQFCDQWNEWKTKQQEK